jgi:AbrB family looped-hinge helix DNA binding protein
MRVTIKGQVTIPQEIREKLNIRPSSNVEFKIAEDGRVYLVKTEEPKGKASRFARLRGAATVSMSTEEIMALTRGDE